MQLRPPHCSMEFVFRYKKSGGHVLTHLLSGSGKPSSKWTWNKTPRHNMQPHNGEGRMHTYISDEHVLFNHPSTLKFTRFRQKGWKRKRSLGQVAVPRFYTIRSTRRHKVTHLFISDKKAGPFSDLLGVFSHTNLYILMNREHTSWVYSLLPPQMNVLPLGNAQMYLETTNFSLFTFHFSLLFVPLQPETINCLGLWQH